MDAGVRHTSSLSEDVKRILYERADALNSAEAAMRNVFTSDLQISKGGNDDGVRRFVVRMMNQLKTTEHGEKNWTPEMFEAQRLCYMEDTVLNVAFANESVAQAEDAVNYALTDNNGNVLFLYWVLERFGDKFLRSFWKFLLQKQLEEFLNAIADARKLHRSNLEILYFHCPGSIVRKCFNQVALRTNRLQQRVSGEDFRILFNSWILGSEFPIHAALYAADIMQRIYELTQDPGHKACSKEFSALGVKIVFSASNSDSEKNSYLSTEDLKEGEDQISALNMSDLTEQEDSLVPEEGLFATSDVSELNFVPGKLAAGADSEVIQGGVSLFEILLVTRDDAGLTVLDIAINSGNVEFLGNAEVSKIVNGMWYDSSLVEPLSFRFFYELCTNIAVFKQPAVQFFTRAFSLLIFIAVFASFLVFESNSVSTSFSVLEIMLYFSMFSFLDDIFIHVLYQGWRYFDSFWSWLNLAIMVPLLVPFILRVIAVLKPSVVTDGYQTAYMLMITIAIFASCWRFLYTFVFSEMFGPLVWIMTRATRNVFSFLIIAVVLHFGFATGFYVVVNGIGITGYDSYWQTVYTLLLAFFDDYNYYNFSGSNSALQEAFLDILFVVYVVLTCLILINLFIAMLNTTFNLVEGESMKHFRYLRSATIYDLHKGYPLLPPPFTLIADVLTLPIEIYDLFRRLFHWYYRMSMALLRGDESQSENRLLYCKNCYAMGRTATEILFFTPNSIVLRRSQPYPILACCNTLDEGNRLDFRLFLKVRLSHVLFCLVLGIPVFLLFSVLSLAFGGTLFLLLLVICLINYLTTPGVTLSQLQLSKSPWLFVRGHTAIFYQNIVWLIKSALYLLISLFVFIVFIIISAFYLLFRTVSRSCSRSESAGIQQDASSSSVQLPIQQPELELPIVEHKPLLTYAEGDDVFRNSSRSMKDLSALETHATRVGSICYRVQQQHSYLDSNLQHVIDELDSMLVLLAAKSRSGLKQI